MSNSFIIKAEVQLLVSFDVVQMKHTKYSFGWALLKMQVSELSE